MTIRAVLDTSAIRAYAAGSIDVGELIGEFSDEGAQFGLPVLCLAEAATSASPHTLRMLNILTHHPDAVILPVEADQWQDAATGSTLYGTLARGCSALAVATGRADYVITAEPHAYPGIDTIGI
ncbi:MAG: hypothetical protein J2P15_04600 [Micromonosporaceae bacterium]|nr:hypothetical protein [Micromonosporaceae bacterium]